MHSDVINAFSQYILCNNHTHCTWSITAMSVVVVQLGQCGNQVGSQLFSTLYSDTHGSSKLAPASCKDSSYQLCSLERFFNERDGLAPFARTVLVDMETKVVHNALLERKRERQWLYDSTSTYQGRRGSGNNWVNGYCKQGPCVCDSIMDLVRREVEKCSHLSGFLVLMSVAGGTGSGLGAFITERLREQYPHVTIVNHVVWPYASGEVIVQNYNALLTTAHLHESSDAIIVSQNDQLHKICSKLLTKEITFTDMNRIVSHSLGSILQPAIPVNSSELTGQTFNSLFYTNCTLSDLVSILTPHPDYKFLTVKTVPQVPDQSHAYSTFRWPGLLKHLKQMLITDCPTEEGMDWSLHSTSSSRPLVSCSTGESLQAVDYPTRGINRSLANLIVMRGQDLSIADPTAFHDPTLYCSWVPQSLSCRVWSHQHQFNRHEKMCSLVSNSQSCVRPLDTVVGKAWRMFSSRAYVHQYDQYGFTEDNFMECFVGVEQIVKNYSSI